MANRKKTICDVVCELQTRVIQSSDCLLWTGKTFSDGYPRINVGASGLFDGDQRAHRVSWRLANNMQPIPKGMKVCHSCDTPLCVYPGHLWLGTNKENMIDAAEKGRLSDFRTGMKYKKKILRIIRCEICGEDSEDRNGKKKFCSPKCKEQNKRNNQRNVERASRMLLRRNA